MHPVLCTRVSPLHVSKPPTECLFWAPDGQEVTQRLDCNFGKWTLPIGSNGRRCNRRGGGFASAFKPRLRLRQRPTSGMVLLMVAHVLRLSQVIHAGLATRDPTCHPPLRGLVSPQNVELSPSPRGSIKQRMVQNASGPVHKSLPTTCLKTTHKVLILGT